jgi:metal-responsive CopG/Arc/MetJ family transcriptional regulator
MAQRAKKEPAGEKVRITVVLNKKVVDEIDEYAAKFKMTRSYLSAILLEDAVMDSRWMHKVIASRVMQPVWAMLRKIHGEDQKKAKEEYERVLAEMEGEHDGK